MNDLHPPAPTTTFYRKNRSSMIIAGTLLLVSGIAALLANAGGLIVLNIIAGGSVLLQGLLSRVIVSPAGISVQELMWKRERAWSDFSRLEYVHRRGVTVLCLVLRDHVPDTSGGVRVWWLPAALRRRSLVLIRQWQGIDQLEHLIRLHAPHLAFGPPGAGVFVPLAPPADRRRPMRFALLVGTLCLLPLLMLVILLLIG